MLIDYLFNNAIVVNNALTSFNRLCNLCYIKSKRTNQSCSPSKISLSISVDGRICDREIVKQFF